MSTSITSYATSSTQPPQSLIAYSKFDGLCYEFRQVGWVPIGVLDADGLIGPIDTSSYATIPVANVSEDHFVFLEEQLPLNASPAPPLEYTDAPRSSLSLQYPSIHPQRENHTFAHATSYMPFLPPSFSFPLTTDYAGDLPESNTPTPPDLSLLSPPHGDPRRGHTPMPSTQHVSNEYRAAIARCSNEFLASTASQLHSLMGDSNLSVDLGRSQASPHSSAQVGHMVFSDHHPSFSQPLTLPSSDDPCSLPHVRRTSLRHRTTQSDEGEDSRQATLPVPSSPSSSSQSVLKLTSVKKGSDKKQTLACLFCRERKIACGRPPFGSTDLTCNQCARRNLHCQYPTESRRGQHKRLSRNLTRYMNKPAVNKMR